MLSKKKKKLFSNLNVSFDSYITSYYYMVMCDQTSNSSCRRNRNESLGKKYIHIYIRTTPSYRSNDGRTMTYIYMIFQTKSLEKNEMGHPPIALFAPAAMSYTHTYI